MALNETGSPGFSPRDELVGVEYRPYETFRKRVFFAFVRTTAVFSFVMAIAEAFVRGPFAWQAVAFAAVGLLFTVVSLYVTRQGHSRVATIVGLGTYVAVFIAIESVSPVHATGIRVASFGFPVAAVLLSGRRVGIAFLIAAALQAIWAMRLVGDSHADALTVLHTIGSIFVGVILLAIAWAFDHARMQAMNLADQREVALREALGKAEAAVEARSNFLANMSHEIRTPMNGVLGLSRVLADELESEEQRALAATVVASGQSLLHVLDDILDLSKLDAEALAVDAKHERPSEIIRQVATLMSARANERGLQIVTEVDSTVPEWANFDGHRFRQILTNLVGNALKFTSKGSVTVHLRHQDDRLFCAVKDTGIGINAETRKQLFTPFVQADTGTARRYGGTGLGLAICKRLCDLMGGAIDVESVPGEGSTFSFELPAPTVTGPAQVVEQTPAPLTEMRVLVAEDNRVNQMVIHRFLKNLGVDLTIVENGAEAVAEVEEKTYDLVLMDWHMPKVDGLEATQRIRQLASRSSKTPIVALTASVMSGDRELCMQAGMNAVLAKPIEMNQLTQTLRRFAPG